VVSDKIHDKEKKGMMKIGCVIAYSKGHNNYGTSLQGYALVRKIQELGYDVEIICNSFDIELDRRYKSSYKVNINYNYVYIDFDDTLIIDGKINSIAMRFIYQSVNRGVKIVLLTKHDTDINDDLKRYKISDS
jgi:hypothetical protein